MSTEYAIADDGADVFLEFSESSGKISIGCVDQNNGDQVWSTTVFTDEDLIKMCVEILKVASYIAEDPESVRAKLHAAIGNDSYLGSMKY